MAYPWAKHGAHCFARKEAVRLGPVGARACSLSPGTFMLSDEAGFLNGIDIPAHGGVFAAVRGD
ncbi:hypothetical protein ACFWD7_02630 [Streptomyces mirabilis]|uniref:hypothetical protein n=1 Tax=Streptomyces mirabilis TaxID=68239 RepID=UPI0021C25316|nr:hypothetical protein [Streptomyces mirabilis]MCT9107008.1 hypothetical protein [Streptomyces mirabilis]